MKPCMSRRKIKIDVWKYIRPILMGLGAILEEKLDDQDRALRRYHKSSWNLQGVELGNQEGPGC